MYVRPERMSRHAAEFCIDEPSDATYHSPMSKPNEIMRMYALRLEERQIGYLQKLTGASQWVRALIDGAMKRDAAKRTRAKAAR